MPIFRVIPFSNPAIERWQSCLFLIIIIIFHAEWNFFADSQVANSRQMEQ